MRELFHRLKRSATFSKWFPGLSLLLLLVIALWFALPTLRAPIPWGASEVHEGTLFTHRYPANDRFIRELSTLREQEKLTPQHEIQIHRSIAQVSLKMEIPRALLWCLFFQESRLNHLLGLQKKRGSYGLGQFGRFAFFELNNQTDNYYPNSSHDLIELLGRDIRPIGAMKSDLDNPSSYFSIPTAVVASAIFLRNRYAHLAKIFEGQGLGYDPELLWLFAAMAYNKGTRGMLSFLNEVKKNLGSEEAARTVRDSDFFFYTIEQTQYPYQAFSRIWPRKSAKRYAEEFKIHSENLRSCALMESLDVNRSEEGL